jgi:surface polysaccharide O-acyltransferase-like enzyme
MLASVSVVIAHCVHFWVSRFHKNRDFLSMDWLCAVVDQFTRFTVPVFFFLSGFGLTLQVMEKGLTLKRYYRHRLFKILAPFAAWSAITSIRHVDWFATLPWETNPWGSVGAILRFLFVDGFDYQYYFLIVIFQFYLVYPFVYKLGRSRLWMGIFLVLHLSILSPVEFFLGLAGLKLPAIHSNLLVYHWFYCFAGIYAAYHKDLLVAQAKRLGRRGVAAFWILVFALLNGEFLANIGFGKLLNEVDHFNRWSVVLYCAASLMLFIEFKPWVQARVYANPGFRFLFTHVAPYTFFVYLAHTHLLRAVDFLFWESTFFDLLNRVVLVVGGSYLLAWTARWLLEDFPRVRACLGLPGKPAMEWSGLPGVARLRRQAAAIAGLRPGRSVSREPAMETSSDSN